MIAYSILNYNVSTYILLFDFNTKQKIYFGELNQTEGSAEINFYEDYYFSNGKVIRKIPNGDDSFDYVPVAYYSNDIIDITISEINSELPA